MQYRGYLGNCRRNFCRFYGSTTLKQTKSLYHRKDSPVALHAVLSNRSHHVHCIIKCHCPCFVLRYSLGTPIFGVKSNNLQQWTEIEECWVRLFMKNKCITDSQVSASPITIYTLVMPNVFKISVFVFASGKAI